MDYYKGLEEIGKTGGFNKIPDAILKDYINDFRVELDRRIVVANVPIWCRGCQ